MMCNRDCNNCYGVRGLCNNIIGALLFALLTFVFGLIIGAVLFGLILSNLAAIIVLAVVLLVLFVIWLIARFCRFDN